MIILMKHWDQSAMYINYQQQLNRISQQQTLTIVKTCKHFLHFEMFFLSSNGWHPQRGSIVKVKVLPLWGAPTHQGGWRRFSSHGQYCRGNHYQQLYPGYPMMNPEMYQQRTFRPFPSADLGPAASGSQQNYQIILRGKSLLESWVTTFLPD